MARQIAQLVRLVDDLLDVSRTSTGKLSVRLERAELSGILTNAVDTTKPLLEARRQKLTIDVPPHPIFLDADPARLAQVIGNLLNNAAKYTPIGGDIVIAVSTTGSQVAIHVTDTGIGIPHDMFDRVFEMFTQVDTSLDRSTAGLGVGLSLSRRLTELHGGTIDVTSPGPGRGSMFTLRLPIASAHPANAHVEMPAPTGPVKQQRIAGCHPREELAGTRSRVATSASPAQTPSRSEPAGLPTTRRRAK